MVAAAAAACSSVSCRGEGLDWSGVCRLTHSRAGGVFAPARFPRHFANLDFIFRGWGGVGVGACGRVHSWERGLGAFSLTGGLTVKALPSNAWKTTRSLSPGCRLVRGGNRRPGLCSPQGWGGGGSGRPFLETRCRRSFRMAPGSRGQAGVRTCFPPVQGSAMPCFGVSELFRGVEQE